MRSRRSLAMKWRLILVVSALSAICLALPMMPSFALADPPTPTRVLVLYYFGRSDANNVALDQSLQTAFRTTAKGSVEYNTEYLEAERSSDESQFPVLRDYLMGKYAGRKIDVIIATSHRMLQFLLKYRPDLFPDTPVVFIALKRRALLEQAAALGITGVVITDAYRSTLNLALTLHPHTERAFIISGTLERDRSLEAEAREELKEFEGRVAFTYLTDRPADDLIASVKGVPERSIILYIRQSRDAPGRSLTPRDFLALIAQSARVPVYGISYGYVGYGLLGGYTSSPDGTGAKVVEQVLRIANGARPQDIPVVEAPNIAVFDWRQLRRWGISDDKLPPGSTVLFRELTFWERYRWQLLGALLLFAVQGFLIAFLLLERTRRRLATGELGSSERRYRQMFEQNRAVQLLVDRETSAIVDANAAAAEFYGYSLQDLRRMNLSDINTSTRTQRTEEVNRATNEGRNYFLFRHRLASGAIRDVEVHTSLLEAGGRTLYYSIIHDITERKRAEAQLSLLQTIGIEVAAANDLHSALEVVLRRVVESTGWAFGEAWIPTHDGTLLECGPQWGSGHGLEEFKAFSRNIRFQPGFGFPGRVWKSREPAWIQNVTSDEIFLRAGVAQQSGLRGALAIPIISGEEVIAVLQFFLREPREEDERMVRVIAAVASQLGMVIERKRAADALNLLNAELEQRVSQRTADLGIKSRELETFAYSVAHDLKAPLRGIEGYSRLLVEDHADKLDEEGRFFLENINNSSEEMNRLIEDLLAYSRIERRTMKPDRLELGPFITALVEQKKYEETGRSIDFVLNVNGGKVVADAIGLTLALRNYLDNAIKFSRHTKAPRIEVGAWENEGSCRVWVRDNGVGFDMKYHDQIFEIFRRLHFDEDYRGTGVGLAIVRKAMERMGGRAWAESETGRGATFYLEIPK